MASKKIPDQEKQTAETAPEKAQDLVQAAMTDPAQIAMEQQAEIERLKKELEAERSKTSAHRKTDKETVQEAAERAIAEGKDPWDVKVAVRARPRTGTTEKHYWMGVNGRFLAVPADDRYHEMALPFAECLVNAMNAETFVKDYADREIKVYDLITNPHEEERAR